MRLQIMKIKKKKKKKERGVIDDGDVFLDISRYISRYAIELSRLLPGVGSRRKP